MKFIITMAAFILLAVQGYAAHFQLEATYNEHKLSFENKAALQYAQGLQSIEARLLNAGQPGAAVAVQQERERFVREGNFSEGAKHTREDVVSLSSRVMQWENERLIELQRAYVERLQALVIELSRARKVKDALAVEERLKSVKSELAARQGGQLERKPPPINNDARPVIGRNWTVPDVGMEFVWIEQMDMWVGKYEVTNGEYRKKEPRHDSRSHSGHSLNGERQPVVYVNFDDAKAYAAWLTERDKAQLGGMRYRVPSEQEFMTYAQCGDGREYPWGNNWPPRSGQAGNYNGQEGAGHGNKIPGYNDGHPVSCDVEKSWANPWGLYGVGGNVWEVCASDSSGGAFGAWRDVSWFFGNQDGLRCANRYGVEGSGRDFNRGFRLVLSR